ncbi:GL21847 [Drosophila persimilis]|uniref:Phosphotransferase n=2 Tax=Drosophila persimilis TaxID=7234 RepID=B4GEC4_DROPE|nr:hexokinase type 2 [Drosophila persimilis]EDW33959.1 GL21847 [Drosophila persimilis]
MSVVPTTIAPEVEAAVAGFMLTQAQMTEVVERMTKEIKMGLARDTHPRAVIKCFVSYVQDLPTGKERGKYLALDLGGSNFRVLLVDLKSNTDIDIVSKSFVIASSMLSGPGKDLFDFIANCLADFCKEQRLQGEAIPLGFTFSFPLQQQGLTKGILVTWTKGFSCEGVVGKNVVALLQEAIERRGDLKINIVAILNDTVGTLMSCAFTSRNCRIGLIVGTGSNACYVEKTVNAECFENYQTSPKPHMIINAEWGAFGDNGVLDFVRTPYDRIVDKVTPNPGKQTFEKCISGMYMGELVRLVLVDLMAKGLIFAGERSEKIQTQWNFQTSYLSDIESDSPGDFRNCSKVISQLGLVGNHVRDKLHLRYICEAVSSRSAKLCSCGLVTLINKMNINDVSVGIDGSVYRFHPRYHDLLMFHMTKLLRPGIKFELLESDDGSGKGAALIAATAVQNQVSK